MYVDDIILARNSMAKFASMQAILDSRFKIKDLGDLKYFLGLEVARSRKGISIMPMKVLFGPPE